MKSVTIKLIAFSAFASVLALALGGMASAHVVVHPAEAVTADFQTFTAGVPNEKNIPTTKLKLVIPDGLQHVAPTQKVGWDIAIEEDNSNESAAVKSITWSGGKIDEGLRDDFTFSAKVPADTTELQWKAYQTYSDGTVVAWDKSSNESNDGHSDENSGPYSITNVVTETTTDTATEKANQAAADAKATADRSLYVAVAGIAVGLVGVFLASRKK